MDLRVVDITDPVSIETQRIDYSEFSLLYSAERSTFIILFTGLQREYTSKAFTGRGIGSKNQITLLSQFTYSQ